MSGLAILFGFNLLGLALEKGLHIPIPGNVIGLILFTASLFLRIVKLEWVEQSAAFLLKHMMLFFAPFVVGTLAFFPIIRESWLSTIVALIGSTLIVMMVTGFAAGSFGRAKSAAANMSAERSLHE
ncbi:CidA/LrgA family protein [Paenibacillus thermoaerophilus]|uniref:CidA/LrgA family protein n=1 Tax=Paenibacillus thermoaerophilus TaxID=1215385 RepID=A0ABW2V501_9BACL|nr:CidA/LrgA family protein [Paenibacillus thermoaerophilus]TMV14324.1 CidA/LrgA family protein [Paenibacillus thermoaerophilus]